MNARRVLAISQKTFLTLRHDPRSIALILLAPIMAMVVFGFAFGSEVRDVPTLVANEDEGDEAAAFIAQLDRETLDVTLVDDVEAARRRVLDAEAVALIVFPRDFTEGLTPQGGAAPQPGVGGTGVGGQAGSAPTPPAGSQIEVFVDASNSQLAQAVQRALAEAGQAYAQERGAPQLLRVDTQSAYAADARFIDYFVPGIMGFAALLFTTLLTLLAFVNERTGGTLDRLRTTPATDGEIVLGYVVAFGVVGAVQGVVLLGAALLLFDVLVVGSVVLAALVVVLLAIDAQAIGILVSAAARREGQAVMFLPFIVLPTMLLSGIFVPVENLPSWLAPLAYALPPTWAIDALRDVMLRGWGIAQVWPHLLVLAGFAVALTGLSVLGLRRARA